MGGANVKPMGDVGAIRKKFTYKYLGSTPVSRVFVLLVFRVRTLSNVAWTLAPCAVQRQAGRHLRLQPIAQPRCALLERFLAACVPT